MNELLIAIVPAAAVLFIKKECLVIGLSPKRFLSCQNQLRFDMKMPPRHPSDTFGHRWTLLNPLPFESLCVFARGDSDYALEGSAHRICGAESTSVRNFLKAHRRTINHLLSPFDP
jgi:hypothetical protein